MKGGGKLPPEREKQVRIFVDLGMSVCDHKHAVWTIAIIKVFRKTVQNS